MYWEEFFLVFVCGLCLCNFVEVLEVGWIDGKFVVFKLFCVSIEMVEKGGCVGEMLYIVVFLIFDGDLFLKLREEWIFGVFFIIWIF